jgi:hypothetical protein
VILNLLSFCIKIVCSWVELSKIGSPSSRAVTFTPDKELEKSDPKELIYRQSRGRKAGPT